MPAVHLRATKLSCSGVCCAPWSAPLLSTVAHHLSCGFLSASNCSVNYSAGLLPKRRLRSTATTGSAWELW